MKKMFTLLLLVLSVFMFSQTYKFDVLTVYSVYNQKKKTTDEIVMYSNTENENYSLKLQKTPDYFIAYLEDSEKNIRHSFNVIETKNGKDIEFGFEYLGSLKNPSRKPNKNFKSEIVQNENEVHLKLYDNKRDKNHYCEYDLNFENNNDRDLFFIFRNAFLCTPELPADFDINKKGIVKSAVINGKNKSTTTLKTFKAVDFEITIPDRLSLAQENTELCCPNKRDREKRRIYFSEK